jgi:hypothetical protein
MISAVANQKALTNRNSLSRDAAALPLRSGRASGRTNIDTKPEAKGIVASNAGVNCSRRRPPLSPVTDIRQYCHWRLSLRTTMPLYFLKYGSRLIDHDHEVRGVLTNLLQGGKAPSCGVQVLWRRPCGGDLRRIRGRRNLGRRLGRAVILRCHDLMLTRRFGFVR